jgi:hypothetical protein
MTFPIQWSWQQAVLMLVAIAAVGLIISSMMSLVVKVKEIEILEDEQGRAYRLMRRRRHFRLHHGIVGLLLLVGAMLILVASVAIQSYLGFTGKIKVATVHTTAITNMPHTMLVDLILYDQNEQQISHGDYSLDGDRWELNGDIVKFQSWLNFFGVHSGYKISRLTSQYDDSSAHMIKPVSLNGGDEDFYNSIRAKTWWSVPAVMAVYGAAVLEPADDVTYDVFMDQTGMFAVPHS